VHRPRITYALGASLAKIHRPKNQDAKAQRCVDTPGGPVLLLVACDGVSSSPKGGPAAALAAERLAELAGEIQSAPASPGDWLKEAVLQAHRRVEGEFLGTGVCCLAAALVVPRALEFWWASVGDSYVLRFDGRGLEQLNTLDQSVRARKVGGDTILGTDGRILLDKGLSQAIGQQGDVEVQVASGRYAEDGSYLVVATDGVSPAQVGDLLERRGPTLDQTAVDEFCDWMRRQSDDDTTLVLVRLGRDQAFDDLARRCPREPGSGRAGHAPRRGSAVGPRAFPPPRERAAVGDRRRARPASRVGPRPHRPAPLPLRLAGAVRRGRARRPPRPRPAPAAGGPARGREVPDVGTGTSDSRSAMALGLHRLHCRFEMGRKSDRRPRVGLM
jgi:serine/threonine protein phosphatase PrpC